MKLKVILIAAVWLLVTLGCEQGRPQNASSRSSVETSELNLAEEIFGDKRASVGRLQSGGLTVSIGFDTDGETARVFNSRKDIEHLYISGLVTGAFLEALKEYDRVKVLELQRIEQEAVPLLSKFSGVESLSIFGEEGIDVVDLPVFEQCVTLDIDACKVDDEGVRHILEFPKLSTFVVGDPSRITDEGRRQLLNDRDWVGVELGDDIYK